MDRTGKIILVVSVLAMLFGMPLAMRFGLIKMAPPVEDENATGTNQVTQVSTNTPAPAPTNPPAITQTNAPSISTNTPAPISTNQPAPPVVEIPVLKEETVTLTSTNKLARFTFTSLGGGLKQVELLKYPVEIGEDPTENPVTIRNDGALMPLLALQPPLKLEHAANSPRPYQTNAIPYTIEKVDDQTVRAIGKLDGYSLANGGRVVDAIEVTKIFRLEADYQIKTEVVLKNVANETLKEQGYYLVSGSVAEPETVSRMMGLNFGLMWFDGVESTSIGPDWFQNYRMGCMCFGSKGERNNYTHGQGNVSWAGAYSRFFAQVTMPEKPGQSMVANQMIVPTQEKPNRKAFETAMALNLPAMAAGNVETYNYTVYAGPREFDRLEAIGNTHQNQLELIMDFGGWFGWVAKGLLLLMNWFSGLGLSYALAIIAITILIKLVFWPLTAKSTRAMKKMAAVNAKMMPEIKSIRERYKDDYQKMNMKMMEIYKKYGVNPLSQMGGCLPMLIQIPIFFGFFTMLRTAIELRGAEFLWVADLSSPDTVAMVAGFPINIMPLLMTGTMFLQMKLQPPSPGMDPAQQAIMKYMPLMFVFILYSASAGLCLYWTVQNVLTIVQTKMTKEDPEEENVVEVIQPAKNKKRKT